MKANLILVMFIMALLSAGMGCTKKEQRLPDIRDEKMVLHGGFEVPGFCNNSEAAGRIHSWLTIYFPGILLVFSFLVIQRVSLLSKHYSENQLSF